MHIDNVIFLILSKNAYTKFSAGPIPLDGNSANYEVEVLYEPLDGIRYEATYVFYVEYPK